jgi:hypothetical protein
MEAASQIMIGGNDIAIGRKASFLSATRWPMLNKVTESNVVATASRLNSRALRLQDAAVIRIFSDIEQHRQKEIRDGGGRTKPCQTSTNSC